MPSEEKYDASTATRKPSSPQPKCVGSAIKLPSRMPAVDEELKDAQLSCWLRAVVVVVVVDREDAAKRATAANNPDAAAGPREDRTMLSFHD